MALLFYDGFDTYNADQTDFEKAGYLIVPTMDYCGVYNNAGITRHGYGQVLQIINGANSGYCIFPGFTMSSTVIIGMAVRIESINSARFPIRMFTFWGCGDCQCCAYLTSDGYLQFYNGETSEGTLLGTTSVNFAKQRWYFWEIKIVVNDSTGSITMKSDGVQVLATDSCDTKASTVYSGISTFGMSLPTLATGSSTILYVDDVYVCDALGGIHDDFLGDCMSLTRLVNGDTARADFTCSSGSDHYALVDELTHDDETTYVESVTDGQYDILEVEDLPTNTTEVLAVAVETWCKLEEAGDTFVINMLNSGGTEFAAADGGLGVHPVYYPRKSIWEKDPKTDAAWTVDNANAIKIGYKIDVK